MCAVMCAVVCATSTYSLLLVWIGMSESCSQPERLISGERFRVQDSFLTASTEDSSFPASGGRLEEDSTSWCSLDPHQLLWPYLQVDFDTVVDVTTLRTAGHEDPDRHVESFRVLVDGGSGGSLNSINASATSMEFTRTSGISMEDSRLPGVVRTRVLRIEAVQFNPQNQACLRLEAFGCLARPACVRSNLLTNPLMGELSASDLIPREGLGMLIDSGDDEWCTTEDIGTSSYFQFNFTQPVFLTYMRVRGYVESFAGFTSSYVQQFALEVGDEYGNFTSYGTEFFPTDYEEETMTIWRPVMGNVFRLRILRFTRTANFNFFGNNVCWKLRIYGCSASTSPVTMDTDITLPSPRLNSTSLLSSGSPVVSTDAATPTDHTHSTSSSMGTTIVDASDNSSVIPSSRVQRNALVGGIVGGVIGLVVIATLITIVAVAIYMCSRAMHKRKSSSGHVVVSGSPVHVLDNDIYGKDVTSGPLYSDSNGKAASYYPAEAAVSSSSPNRCETLFSGIPHSGESVQYSKLHEMSEVSQLPGSDGGTPSSELYEEIKDIQRHDAKNGADGSLQDNPLYGKYLS